MHYKMHAGSDDSLAWAAQAVTGGGIWAFGLFFLGGCSCAEHGCTGILACRLWILVDVQVLEATSGGRTPHCS